MHSETAVQGVANVQVSDVRTVQAWCSGLPELRTRAGRDPIRPCHVKITYDIASGRVYGLQVSGYRSARNAGDPAVLREVMPTDAPDWLRALVEEQAP